MGNVRAPLVFTTRADSEASQPPDSHTMVYRNLPEGLRGSQASACDPIGGQHQSSTGRTSLNNGQAASLAEMVGSPATGQRIARAGSFQRTPSSASGV